MKVANFILVATLNSFVTAQAALLVYEPFDYPADTQILGRTNGTGFSSPWEVGGFNVSTSGVLRMKPGVMSYPGLAVRGNNRASAEAVGEGHIAGLRRFFGADYFKAGTTNYISFLHQPEAEAGYSSVVLGMGRMVELSIGKSGSLNMYHLSSRGGGSRVLSETAPIVGKVAFLVAKLEILDGFDRFTLYVNPAVGQPEPMDGLVNEEIDLQGIDRITLYSRGAWSVDELRLGTTWADVTPAAVSTK